VGVSCIGGELGYVNTFVAETISMKRTLRQDHLHVKISLRSCTFSAAASIFPRADAHRPTYAGPMSTQAPLSARVVTVSDRSAAGQREDRSGPLAAQLLAEHGLDVDRVVVVPDGIDSVRRAIKGAMRARVRLVLTTGGTGVAPRDLTPEATEPLLVTRLDGLAEAIRRRGAPDVPAAVLSRGLAGLTDREPGATLIVNAPGSTGGVRDAVAVLGPLAAHVLAQVDGADH
jgi:molybdenum cofactor synthesis domain-containing protein